MDDTHLAGYAWDKSVKTQMTVKQKLFASRISLTIIVLVFTMAMDIVVFYTIPLRHLYPSTLLNNNTESLQIAAILFHDFNPTFTGINNETKRRILAKQDNIDIPFITNTEHFSYNPTNCVPPLARSEVLFSAHYNAIAYIAYVILPESSYRETIMWIREHTKW